MYPVPWEKQNLTRDSSIVYHAGEFHAVWTTSWKGDCVAANPFDSPGTLVRLRLFKLLSQLQM